MTKIPYPKHLIFFANQITLLKQRGLVFTDEVKALYLLRNISYYRLSGYWYPLLADKQNHRFKSGSTFDAAYKNKQGHYKSVIKLDKNFHIYIHGDRRLIEQGEDNKGKFYRICYKEEQ